MTSGSLILVFFFVYICNNIWGLSTTVGGALSVNLQVFHLDNISLLSAPEGPCHEIIEDLLLKIALKLFNKTGELEFAVIMVQRESVNWPYKVKLPWLSQLELYLLNVSLG